jgi:hypothetical protein
MCQDGKFKAVGQRVLLEAILEEEASGSDLAVGVDIDMRKAVAFYVRDVGPKCTNAISVGDLVVNLSISGERVGSKASRWMVVHEDDLAVTAHQLT